jgi:hypothetical protein
VPVLCGEIIKLSCDVYRTVTVTVTLSTMSNVDWDSKVVIGNRGKVPKVTRKATDLNGAFHLE